MHSDATESGFKGRIFDSPAFAMAVTKADRMKMKEAEKLRRLKAQVEPTQSYLEFEKLRAAAMAEVAEDVLNNRLKAERAEAAKKANKEKTTTSMCVCACLCVSGYTYMYIYIYGYKKNM